ncbi:hypothetical protein SAMN04487916_10647, partial [Arthrobacter sp. ov407]|uniref:PKD domain-containing protein n=1 Tax=Arthrobacter sp. ov407 TaxID=1761748 RepID=UPI0008869036
AAGSGVAPSHTYAAAGTFQVKLTVTDNQGGTGSVTKPVTVTATAAPLAQDGFNRTVANGLGNADIGGSWTLAGGNTSFAVSNGSAKLVTGKSVQLSAILGSVSSTSSDTQFRISLDKQADGGGFFTTVIGRRVAGVGSYFSKVWITKSGAMTLELKSAVGSTETSLRNVLVPNLVYTAGMELQVRLQVSGTSPTVLQSKVWKAVDSEPTAWQVTATDATPALQTAGSVGLITYLSASATNGPVTLTLKEWVTRRPE